MNLIDAEPLIADESLLDDFGGDGISQASIVQKNAKTEKLERAEHVGNSGEQPKIGSAGTTQDRSPLDAVYLNNSASIIAKKRPHSDAWKFPQESIKWEWTSVSLSDFISKTEQVNMQESTKSHLGLGEEMALTILCMAASLVPYVGPFLATAGSLGIEQLKGVTTDSPASLPFGDCIR